MGKILIIGNGYLGNRCHEAWDDAVIVGAREIKTKEDVLALIDQHQPDAILNAAGRKGKPNVDWCEDHQAETIVGNTLQPILIALACQERDVYLLHLGSGCIFYGDSPHPDKAWREDDFGNPLPVYSRSKWAADLVLSTLPHVGIARIRMPIDDRPAPGNLIDKLATYPTVMDVENSLTIIPDMIEVFHQLIEKKAAGIFHVTNPGTVKHRQIMDLYTELVDSTHTNEWASEAEVEERGLISKARSNNFLHNENLEKVGITMPDAHASLRKTMEAYAKRKKDM